MVTMTVRPLRDTFLTDRITMAAALASKPASTQLMAINTMGMLMMLTLMQTPSWVTQGSLLRSASRPPLLQAHNGGLPVRSALAKATIMWLLVGVIMTAMP